jgi:hypothetical protein
VREPSPPNGRRRTRGLRYNWGTAATYETSIPPAAVERVLDRHPGGRVLRAEYVLDRQVVGLWEFHEAGEPRSETPLKDGRPHGTVYCWDEPGTLVSAEPYADGLAHGTARQWDDRGRLVGSYRMVRGTGWDLWRDPGRDGGPPTLSEAVHYEAGQPHRFEWWFDGDGTVWWERHWCRGEWHGGWRGSGAGRAGCGVATRGTSSGGERVTKRQYLRACAADPSLPPFRPADQVPARTFPPAVARHLRLQGHYRPATATPSAGRRLRPALRAPAGGGAEVIAAVGAPAFGRVRAAVES